MWVQSITGDFLIVEYRNGNIKKSTHGIRMKYNYNHFDANTKVDTNGMDKE